MIGMDMLRSLLASAPPAEAAASAFVHVDVATAAAMYAARNVDLATIACLADGGLAQAARRAMLDGFDILWVGMAPKDVRVGPDGFTAIVALRIDGEDRQRSVLIRGDGENRIVAVADVAMQASR